MGFAHAQASASATVNGSSTTLNVALASNPAAGDLVCVGVLWFDGAGGTPASLTVVDSNGNAYTKSTSSPALGQVLQTGAVYLFYLNNAPANASKTITATYTNPGAGGAVELIADDFTVSGGTSAFDLDAVGSGSGGTNINTPTVPRTGTGELLYCYASPQSAVTSVNSPWTQGAIGTDATASGYILSASADTALNMTAVAGDWDSVGASFSFTPGGGGGGNGATLMGQAML